MIVHITSGLLPLLLFASALAAQEPDTPRADAMPRNGFTGFGVDALLAVPLGEFGDAIPGGIGYDLGFGFAISRIPVELELGIMRYDDHAHSVCVRELGCSVALKAKNEVLWLSGGPYLVAPSGVLRPYLIGTAGVAMFNTTTTLRARSDTIAKLERNVSRKFAWSVGSGVLVVVPKLDAFVIGGGVRYHDAGRAEYFARDDLGASYGGEIVGVSRRSRASFLTIRLGGSIGYRP